jgi:hypothetical protein
MRSAVFDYAPSLIILALNLLVLLLMEIPARCFEMKPTHSAIEAAIAWRTFIFLVLNMLVRRAPSIIPPRGAGGGGLAASWLPPGFVPLFSLSLFVFVFVFVCFVFLLAHGGQRVCRARRLHGTR